MFRGFWAIFVLTIVTPFYSLLALGSSLIRGRPVDLRPAVGWSRAMLWAVGGRVTYRGVEQAHRQASAPQKNTEKPSFHSSTSSLSSRSVNT